MGKKYKNLFMDATSITSLWKAYYKARKHKRTSTQYQQFYINSPANINYLSERIRSGLYQVGKSRSFIIYEPKEREITAIPFPDRVVQHAIYASIAPIFESVFLDQSFACRPNKGAHKASEITQYLMGKSQNQWYLKTDFSKYFKSLDLSLLNREIRRKISCNKMLDLIGKFLPLDGTGIPIGHLLSQLFANIYGHIMDRWLLHEMGVKDFVRYMDDVVIFGKSYEDLFKLYQNMLLFVSNHMKLKFSKWQISHVSKGVNFCGYRIWSTHKLLRKRSVKKMLRKFSLYMGSEWESRELDFIQAFNSWQGHSSWANSYNLVSRFKDRILEYREKEYG